MPQVPTVAEAGASLGSSRFDVSTWFGLFGPAKLQPEVTRRLNKAFVDALNSPELKQRLATLMAEPSPTTPEQFADFVKSELAKYEPLVKASGAQAN
jgi:tripartite-type tricarboxylate transporter receptor subunit TctC